MKINMLTPNHPDFPEQLKTIPAVPKKLFILGNPKVLHSEHIVAIVGSRKASSYGTATTQQIVRELAKHQVCVISGLALGVDGTAHTEALAAGTPTAAVLPSGLDEFYPRSHHQLAKQILDAGGALVSEYPEGTPPLRNNFIERNRIVSGLASTVIVTEAAEKSGTLHTANFALEQGKTVMAVPGNITSHLSQGTNKLIKAGAEPITKPSDVLFALGISDKPHQQQLLGDTEEEVLLLSLLAKDVTDVNELQARSKLDPSLFNQTLTMLEINGKIRSIGSGQWTIL